jgi:hypothetical protein
MLDIIGSVVVFKNNEAALKKTIDSFLRSNLKLKLFVIDNSPTDDLRSTCLGERVEYIFNNCNLGFGSGHNISIRKMMGKTKYSLILNPDVYFGSGTLEKLFNFMENTRGVGLLMPKVLYLDGSLQYLCRLLPTPYDSLLRKINFKALNFLFNKRKIRYELRFADYNKLMDVPYLSGCFMFIRTDVFEKVGVFDERFFIYFEDVDLSRRINKAYRNVYFPEAVIHHGYERGSEKNIKLFWQLILSCVKYFNKWGWFIDQERSLINAATITKLKE